MYAHEHAAEMGRNSKFGEAAAEMGRNSKLGEAAPAVELEGDMLAEYDKKGFNPGIRVHLVP